MMRIPIVAMLLVAACVGSRGEPTGGEVIRLVNAFQHLSFERPLFFCHAGDDSGLVYVVEQPGRIWRFPNDQEARERELFLDISARIPARRHNEEGLLALAFHPKFKDNGLFFINYSQHRQGDKPRRGVLSSFKTGENGLADLDSERVLLEVEQPWGNHNGCMLEFGPDGFLYASFGDGGSAGDPRNDAQNLSTLLGTILRLDVDREQDGLPYAIPPDNPFVGREGARPEIWAWGLRNVWRMAFDRETGLLWAGDVGQVAREEVNIITRGGNYGWRAREGFIPYKEEETKPGMIDPIVDYGRHLGISITGGYVYRGSRYPSLRGVYLYADYGSGRIWGLQYDVEQQRLVENRLLAHYPRAAISSFGQDAQGELYVCGHLPGVIYRVTYEP
jgi:glucose/arabinose dehydrogenase